MESVSLCLYLVLKYVMTLTRIEDQLSMNGITHTFTQCCYNRWPCYLQDRGHNDLSHQQRGIETIQS